MEEQVVEEFRKLAEAEVHDGDWEVEMVLFMGEEDKVRALLRVLERGLQCSVM